MKNNYLKNYWIMIMVAATSFISSGIQAQSIENATTTQQTKNYEYYLKKQKNQKLTGWIFLTGGAAMGITGLIIQTATATTTVLSLITLQPLPEEYNQTGNYVGTVGLVAMATSIPFFIASGKNKNRAKIAFEQEKITLGHKRYQQSNYNSIALTIRLGK